MSYPLALAFIKKEEGLRLQAYLCPAKKLSIGYGHTGPDVRAGLVITVEQAESLLDRDIETAMHNVQQGVKRLINANQVAALVDFVFNAGAGAFLSSTLLVKLNAGDIQGAADELLRWDKAHVDGEVVEIPGLLARRQRERELFLQPVAA